MPTKPGVVLVHGAWHTSWHFENVVTELAREGYMVEAPTLPTVGHTAVDDAMAKAIATVKQAIINITSSGRDAVVLCHSFGGVVGSEGVAAFEEERRRASDGSKQYGRITHLLYICAIIIEEGADCATRSSGAIAEELKDGMGRCLEPERFYNTMDPALAQKCAARLLPQNRQAFAESAKYCGWGRYGIPATYIVCKQDRALPATVQTVFVERIKAAGVKDFKIERIDCDHTPWLSSGRDEFFRILWDVMGRATLQGGSTL
ncbi:uncharacterized protein RCC_06313 [Ramularia collo-cygni]|uniref:AB hydrolase-1 domain-containing protein n=1 Tax=Ramularia collo-cygni TaxID=112498 RepID=A0A2D3VI42_9PEZI|nr:uncharacterized protein RCC_06313 [Ramularia collo-cygni]CZT20453.1 uncharacterized protein RCC_06313 [Ramularia collo-cygni]